MRFKSYGRWCYLAHKNVEFIEGLSDNDVDVFIADREEPIRLSFYRHDRDRSEELKAFWVEFIRVSEVGEDFWTRYHKATEGSNHVL
jgi:hypothetical protein